MRRSVEIKLTEADRSELERLAQGRRVWRSLSDRAHIVLLAAEGLTNVQIANTLGINSHTARKWRNRFAEQRMDGLEDETRSGRPRCIDDDAVAEVIRKTLEETPRDATHWSTRSMARATGYAPSTIHRMWQAFSLQPHRSETFKLSADPYFVDKVRDIVGLYMDPPQHALVLCVDEKSQVQALDRTQPCCRCGPARSSDALMTTSLAMARLRCSPPSTSPPGRSSDSATGATAARSSGSSWITSRPTFRPTSRSTSSWTTTRPTRRRRSATGSPGVRAGMSISRRPLPSWLNQVERFFADLTEKQIRRGVHRSTAELERAITDYIETVNEAPKPFRWHKSADDILASIKRFCLRTLETAAVAVS